MALRKRLGFSSSRPLNIPPPVSQPILLEKNLLQQPVPSVQNRLGNRPFGGHFDSGESDEEEIANDFIIQTSLPKLARDLTEPFIFVYAKASAVEGGKKKVQPLQLTIDEFFSGSLSLAERLSRCQDHASPPFEPLNYLSYFSVKRQQYSHRTALEFDQDFRNFASMNTVRWMTASRALRELTYIFIQVPYYGTTVPSVCRTRDRISLQPVSTKPSAHFAALIGTTESAISPQEAVAMPTFAAAASIHGIDGVRAGRVPSPAMEHPITPAEAREDTAKTPEKK